MLMSDSLRRLSNWLPARARTAQRLIYRRNFPWGSHLVLSICGRMHALQSWLDHRLKLGVHELQGDEIVSACKT
jgi:hypothetical protein